MLKGTKVNLRTVRRRDLATLLDLASDIEARGPYFPLALPTETSQENRFNKDGMWGDENGTMLIVEKDSDRILGSVVWFKPCHYYDAVELGYIIFLPSDRGKGFTSEAVTMFSKYLFALKPISRIQLQIDPENYGSQMVAKKCGFKLEGTARQAFISNGVPRDLNVYSLIR